MRMKEGEYVGDHKRRTTSSLSLDAQNAESCAVCRTKLSSSLEPKLLPCLHIMCKVCSENSTRYNRTKACPVCGQSFNLSEVTDCFIFEDSAPKCGGCEESAISGWCHECEEALCSDCVSAHQRVKVTRNHTVIPQEHQSGLTTSLRCTSHKEERLKFFCVTCNQLTCRDCQLINHRNHSFYLIEEAVITQKERLVKLLDSIKEQENSVRDGLQDLEGRLHYIKELKASSKKQLHTEVQSLYTSLLLRCQQLSKGLEVLCNEEEKSLKVMRNSLKKLKGRHEYITAFLQKILSTNDPCILRHKPQIEKCTQRVLSQRQFLPDSVLYLSLSVNEQISHNIKNFASFRVTRVPPPAKEKRYHCYKPKNTPKETEKCHSGLDSGSAETLSVSDYTVTQTTVPTMFLAASNFPPFRKSKSDSSKPVQHTQDLTDTSSHASPCSTACNSDLVQTTPSPSNMTQNAVTQHLSESVSPQASQSQQVILSQSHPLLTAALQSNSSLPSQTVLNITHTNLPGNCIVMPKGTVPQAQSGGVLVTAAPPGINFCHTVARRSVSLLASTFQSSHSSSLNNSQSPSLASNQFVPSLTTLAPFVQSILNESSNHAQQSISQSQAVSGPSFSSQIASTNQILPHISAVSNTQSVDLQPSQSDDLQPSQSDIPLSNELKFSLFKLPSNISSLNNEKLQFCTPALTINKGTAFTCALQPAPNLTIVPFNKSNGNKDLDPLVSGTPPVPAALVSSVHRNMGLIECGTETIQIPKCELLVKAPADPVCEGDTSACSIAPPVIHEADGNLPTSTVLDKDATAREVSAAHQPQDLLTSSLLLGFPFNQSILNPSKSPDKRISTLSSTGNPPTKHWLTDLPTSFKELVTGEKKVIAKDSCSKNLKPTSSANAKEDYDKTAVNSDSELVKGVDEFQGEPILQQDSNKTPLVSLLRLPIPGSTLSQFRIVSSSQKDVILLQEIEANQTTRRCFRIAAPRAAASPSRSCSSECLLEDDVHDCAVCLSAGTSLQCAKCDRNFHDNCHVPPIVFDHIAMWVCSLCQDLLDDTDPFRCDRLKEPYLSLPDQRRCEQLLLTLMCETNSYLLYKTIKKTVGCLEFNFIVARLLGKCHPPYRSAGEMVSDLWALFDKLSSNSKKKDLIAKLQNSFQHQLNVSFGKSLHASLSRGDQTGAPETALGRVRAKNTLKRMREFLTENCTTSQAKKAHTVNTEKAGSISKNK